MVAERNKNRANLSALTASVIVEKKLDKPEQEKKVREKKIVAPKEEVKKIRKKRCYILTDLQIKRLMLLNLKLHKGEDLSDIIGKALDFYYETKLSKEERKFLEENF
jgi:hypothetical protein